MKTKTVDLVKIRQAIAEYMQSEGCSCCQNIDKHREDKAIIATLLNIRKYSDGSGYDFGYYRTKNKK